MNLDKVLEQKVQFVKFQSVQGPRSVSIPIEALLKRLSSVFFRDSVFQLTLATVVLFLRR